MPPFLGTDQEGRPPVIHEEDKIPPATRTRPRICKEGEVKEMVFPDPLSRSALRAWWPSLGTIPKLVILVLVLMHPRESWIDSSW